MQTVRGLKKEPVGGLHRGLILNNVVQHGLVDPVRMDTVRRLPELVRIAQQYKVVGGARDCENVCERHLTGFIDDKVVQFGWEASPSEEPGRASDELNLVCGQRSFDR